MKTDRLNIILLILFILIVSCNNQKSKRMIEQDTTVNRNELTFEYYKINDNKNILTVDSSTVDMIYEKHKQFFNGRYIDREGLDKYFKVFAGKYLAIDLLQGSETVRTYIFDSKTGAKYESPLFMVSVEYHENSRLFIKDPVLSEKNQKDSTGSMFNYKKEYYEWNEEMKKFYPIN